ncbi:MAG: AAA domain-containing protein [Candidatus Magasanikbacteria bacterium]|nr:AAA domain-containing protein [Candidatus Magasanikbacteria bacterium]
MNPEQFLERFSTHLKNTIARAISIAVSMQHTEVSSTHLILAIIEEDGSVGAEIIQKSEPKKKKIASFLQNNQSLKNEKKKKNLNSQIPELDDNAKQSLERAMLIAYKLKHNYIGTEHLLSGLLNSDDKNIKQIFSKKYLDKKELERQINTALESISKFPKIEDVGAVMDQIQGMPDETPLGANPIQGPGIPMMPIPQLNKKKTDITSYYTTNLTSTKIQKNIDPVVGREKEIERIINILARRTKNNPVLIGEPGVGKTAIIEGLAKNILKKETPQYLHKKKILSLDLTLLISGTIYRGEFESRLKQIIDTVSSNEDIILFIDEIHNIIGTGTNQGTMDAANILKPALARGNLRCIGATTIDEYKKYIHSDPALERRFQEILIDETSQDETFSIIKGIKDNYEKYHNTQITNSAIRAAVEMSSKYIHDNFLPDKAIDLIDEASASVNIKRKINSAEKKFNDLTQELDEIKKHKNKAITEEKYSTAKKLKQKEAEINKKIEKARQENTKKQSRKRVTEKDVANVLSNRLKIDKKILLSNEWEQLNNLKKRMTANIFGQDDIMESIVKTLQKSHLRSKKHTGAFASMIFVGPSGVGKTETAKILARELFHDKDALIKLDMSEFSESHGISKLLGSPAGYVGYNDRNLFLEKITKKPYSVVLFDEFDKAHASIRRLLLQILDDGYLTDSIGKKISFNHAIIIITTNIASELFKSSGIGFENIHNFANERNQILKSKLKEKFGTELIDRMENIHIFNPLTRKDLKKIVTKKLDETIQNVEKSQALNIVSEDKIIDHLIGNIFSEKQGARQIKKTVEDIIHKLIVDFLSNRKNDAKKNPDLKLKIVNDKIKFIENR